MYYQSIARPFEAFRIGINAYPDWFFQDVEMSTMCYEMRMGQKSVISFTTKNNRDVRCHSGDFVFKDYRGYIVTSPAEEFLAAYEPVKEV